MYFKIEKDSDLYQKFVDLRGELVKCHKASIDFIKDNYGEDHLFVPDYINGLSGGIISVGFEKPPKGWVEWENEDYPDMYQPDKDSKKGSKILDEIKKLPIVKRGAVRDLLNLDEKYGDKILIDPAFGFQDDVIYISLPDYINPKNYTPIEGMVEITHSEYHDLAYSD